jgi:RND family efflux transporter MFP subunit
MKKVKYIGAAVIILVVIAAILIHNRQELIAKNKIVKEDAYYVSVEKISKQLPQAAISFTGVVAANNDVNIVSETSGKVTGMFFNIGEAKKAGTALVQVDDELKKAAYNTAEANYDKSKKDYERYEALYKQKSITETQLDQAKLAYVTAESQFTIAKRQLRDTKISTPISGIVTSKNVDLGVMVQQGMVIANIVDVSKLKVKVNVSESDVFKLKKGDDVTVTTDVFPGVNYRGKIESISAKGDDAHTYPVEITVANDAKNQLKSGMFARVNFTSLKTSEIVALPRAALVGSLKDPQVFVVDNSIAHLRSVVLGGEYGTFVEIISGINAGETVVVSGQNIITDGVKVIVVAQ